MRILLKENPILNKAHEKYVSFSMDPELVDAYEARMKWKLDHESALDDALTRGLKQGMEKGIEKGMEQGRAEGREKGREEGFLRSRMDIAKKMLDKGYDYDVISECTGMDVTELKKLANS